MNDSAILSLIAIGGMAIFGMQVSISLAVNHHHARTYNRYSACDKVSLSDEAEFAKIPVPYFAVIHYGFVLIQLFYGMYREELNLYMLNCVVFLALLVSCYYSWLMFVKLRIICLGCVRIHLVNVTMAMTLFFYHIH